MASDGRGGQMLAPAPSVVFVALCRVYVRTGRATVRQVAAEAGLASASTCHTHLRMLRRLGLVAWDEACDGTLRPNTIVVWAAGGPVAQPEPEPAEVSA